MSVTRLEKYKKYRQSIQEFKAVNNEAETAKERDSRIVSEKMNTTSTLPMEEVLGKLEESKDQEPQRVMNQKTVVIIVLSVVGLLLVAGIVVFAIIAFGGQR